MNNGSYGSYGSSYGGGGGGGAATTTPHYGGPQLRRRHHESQYAPTNGNKKYGSSSSPRNVVKKLDFMFPKVDQEFTVKTDGGGVASLVACILITILVLAEVTAWMEQNKQTTEHISVDTSLGKRMRVNLNMTFPGLACEDLHVDVMDVAGDSQLHIEDKMVKKRLSLRGKVFGESQEVEHNVHRRKQHDKEKILENEVPSDYCGPCFGAQDHEGQCCNTCKDLISAYEKKRWRTDIIVQTSEQCIREGKDRMEPKRMKKGEGCNIAGTMTLNRVAGNFHIAMGEGIERDGRHIHSFVPEDTPNFNASHVIHHLSFGSPEEVAEGGGGGMSEHTPLNGVTKIVSKQFGTTGLFQYFIKIVPTTYIDPTSFNKKESNRYFFTERFRPLMSRFFDDDDVFYDDDDLNYRQSGSSSKSKSQSSSQDTEEEDDKVVQERKKRSRDDKDKRKRGMHAGAAGTHSNHDHHDYRNAILPGVFFIYEIYPFAVEITPSQVPITHLLIRIMATAGGVFTIVRWADSLFYSLGGGNKKKRSPMG